MKKLPCFKALIVAYNIAMELRDIYEQQITKEEGTKLIEKRIKKAKKYRRVSEILAMAYLIEKRIDTVTNYFISRHSNARAESMNTRISTIVRDCR